MAGGNFDMAKGKDRPGTYINFESDRPEIINIHYRGIVLLPLLSHNYGPEKQFVTIDAENPDSAFTVLGCHIYDSNSASMLLIRQAFKNARKVVIYIPKQGAKATATYGDITATAKYGGSRGNDLHFSVTENPVKGFDATVYLDEIIVSQYEALTTIEELTDKNDAFIDFSGTGALYDIAGAELTGGTDGVCSVADITEFLDKSESVKWTTMAFALEADPTDPDDPVPALFETVKSKIKYLREDAGKYRKAVVPKFNADYEGVINVTNSVFIRETPQSEKRELSLAEVTAWVAGADAGASNVQSNTYTVYDGAVDISGLKSHIESISAIRNGEFFFSFSEADENIIDVVVEYDINSLVTFKKPKDKTYRKNRILRVFDTFAENLMREFPPNKFDNNALGWDVMDGLGKSLLKKFYEAGAIKNVDYDSDFLVDRTISRDDETYFNVALEAVDSSEKLFFTIKTR